MHSEDSEQVRPCSVYRIYAADGTLIYVGVTDRGQRRQVEHINSKQWAREMAETHWEHYESREKALSRERELIITQHPKYNLIHHAGGDPEQMEYRLRAEQYDLLKQSQVAYKALHAEYDRFVKAFEQRFEAWEKINAVLRNSVRDNTPIGKKKSAKIKNLLEQIEQRSAGRKKRDAA